MYFITNYLSNETKNLIFYNLTFFFFFIRNILRRMLSGKEIKHH